MGPARATFQPNHSVAACKSFGLSRRAVALIARLLVGGALMMDVEPLYELSTRVAAPMCSCFQAYVAAKPNV